MADLAFHHRAIGPVVLLPGRIPLAGLGVLQGLAQSHRDCKRVVLSKENTKGWRTSWYKIPEIAFPEVFTHEGGEVAVVAAEDMSIAQKALDLVEVEYEVLKPMLDGEETLNAPPPPLVGDEEYPGREIFDRKPFVIKRGDVEKENGPSLQLLSP